MRGQLIEDVWCIFNEALVVAKLLQTPNFRQTTSLLLKVKTTTKNSSLFFIRWPEISLKSSKLFTEKFSFFSKLYNNYLHRWGEASPASISSSSVKSAWMSSVADMFLGWFFYFIFSKLKWDRDSDNDSFNSFNGMN